MAVQHTTVPYLWRRVLSCLRFLVGICCSLLYIVDPVRNTVPIAFIGGAYTVYAGFLLFRDAAESKGYSPSSLYLDLLFLWVCVLHPAQASHWLAALGFFFLLGSASLLFAWQQVAIVVLAVTGMLAMSNPGALQTLWPALSVGGVLSLSLTLQKERLLRRLSAALKRSVLSRSEAEIAREHERQRIAADFHDGPLQSFISFQMRLELIRKLMTRDPSAAMRELIQLQDLGRSQVTELRSFVRNMQPADVTPSNLGSAIREAVEHFERDSGIHAELLCGELSGVDEAVAGELLQLVREALNNVRKHSKGSRVALSVDDSEDEIGIRIEDDGSGYPFSGKYSLDELEVLRIGPRSIKRRVRTLGGDLTLDSKPSEGSRLNIRVPNR